MTSNLAEYNVNFKRLCVISDPIFVYFGSGDFKGNNQVYSYFVRVDIVGLVPGASVRSFGTQCVD